MKQRIKFIFTTWFIAISLFTINAQDVQTNKNDMENLNLTNEWDKTFPQSDKVKHSKVTFRNRYGITLAADLYMPKNAEGKLPAIAVCGPFGPLKEQASGLYAHIMAERGFLTIAFDPSFTGESGGAPRYVASPDINTEDFCAAVDFLSLRDDVDSERIGIIGICGWGGLAINAAAIDTRIKATVASTMYDMSRCTANGYHSRSLNSNNGWNKTSALSFLNAPILAYSDEIRSAVLLIHGEKAHSRYFSEDAFKKLKGDNKELMIVSGANHTDLYDRTDIIPFDKLESFFKEYLK